MRNPSLHGRTVATGVLSFLLFVGVATSACDSNNGSGGVTTASPVVAFASISPSLVNLTALAPFNCPGVAFTTSFDLIIVAGGSQQRMDAATFQLLDGTTVGGPSVTIPSPQLTSQFGSLIILPGGTRSFHMRPEFGCAVGKPQTMVGTVSLFDQHGRQQLLKSTVNIR